MIGFGVKMDEAALAAVDARLKEMRGDLKYKAINSGLVYAARPIRDAMRAAAPMRTGKLRKSIGTRLANTRQKRRLGIDPTMHAVIVGPRSTHGRIANVLEGGAKPHIIRPRDARTVLRLYGNKFVAQVSHPGIKARWFIDSGHRTGLADMEGRFLVGVAAYLDKKDRAAERDLDPE